jgi:hypothetical protein
VSLKLELNRGYNRMRVVRGLVHTEKQIPRGRWITNDKAGIEGTGYSHGIRSISR